MKEKTLKQKKKIKYRIKTKQKGDKWIATIPKLFLKSEGATKDEALETVKKKMDAKLEMLVDKGFAVPEGDFSENKAKQAKNNSQK